MNNNIPQLNACTFMWYFHKYFKIEEKPSILYECENKLIWQIW